MIQQTELEKKSLSITKQANELKITDQNDLVLANKLLNGTKVLIKEIKNTFDPIVSKALATHREAIAQRNRFLIPAEKNEKTIKLELARFDDEQEAIRKKEEYTLRRQAEEKERKLKEKAVEALKNGDEKKAEKFIEKSAEIPIPVVAPKFDKPNNISFSMHYEAVIIDKKLIPRVLNGIELLIPDIKAINKLARSTNGTIQIPGIKIISDKRVTSRTDKNNA